MPFSLTVIVSAPNTSLSITSPIDVELATPDAVSFPSLPAAYRRLLEQSWTDAIRQLHPNETIYTYWDYGIAFRRNQGFRMDFLLLSPALASGLKDANVRAREGYNAPKESKQ